MGSLRCTSRRLTSSFSRGSAVLLSDCDICRNFILLNDMARPHFFNNFFNSSLLNRLSETGWPVTVSHAVTMSFEFGIGPCCNHDNTIRKICNFMCFKLQNDCRLLYLAPTPRRVRMHLLHQPHCPSKCKAGRNNKIKTKNCFTNIHSKSWASCNFMHFKLQKYFRLLYLLPTSYRVRKRFVQRSQSAIWHTAERNNKKTQNIVTHMYIQNHKKTYAVMYFKVHNDCR